MYIFLAPSIGIVEEKSVFFLWDIHFPISIFKLEAFLNNDYYLYLSYWLVITNSNYSFEAFLRLIRCILFYKAA